MILKRSSSNLKLTLIKSVQNYTFTVFNFPADKGRLTRIWAHSEANYRWFFPCSRPVSSSGCCWEPPSSVCCCSGWQLGLAWSPGCTWLKSATGSTARWDTSSLSCRQLVHEILTLPDKLRFAVEPRATLLIMHAGIYLYPDVFPDTGGEKWCDQLYFLLSNMCFSSSSHILRGL